MDYKKIFIEALRAIMAGKIPRYAVYHDGRVIFTYDGHRLFVVDEAVMPFKAEAFTLKKFDFVEKLLDPEGEYAARTGEYRKIANRYTGKIELVEKVASAKNYAWVNIKFLDIYGKDVSYVVKSARGAVVIKRGDDVIGCVLPVRMED